MATIQVAETLELRQTWRARSWSTRCGARRRCWRLMAAVVWVVQRATRPVRR